MNRGPWELSLTSLQKTWIALNYHKERIAERRNDNEKFRLLLSAIIGKPLPEFHEDGEDSKIDVDLYVSMMADGISIADAKDSFDKEEISETDFKEYKKFYNMGMEAYLEDLLEETDNG